MSQDSIQLSRHTWPFSMEQLHLNLGAESGKHGHPQSANFFLWLAIRNRCWIADRLARRNLPHPERCLFCDQEAEDIQHILTTCVFTRDFWFRVLSVFGWQLCVPSRHEFSFSDWWRKSAKKIQKDKRKSFNTLVVLGAWIIWKHRNACTFEGARPSLDNLF